MSSLMRKGTLKLCEPQNDKTSKMTCAPSKDSDQPGNPPSLISLHCALNGQLRTKDFFMQRAKTDQNRRMPRLIFVFAWRTGHFIGFVMLRLTCSQRFGSLYEAKHPSFLHAYSEDSSNWADAQADLSLRWAHIPFCWFCHEVAHTLWVNMEGSGESTLFTWAGLNNQVFNMMCSCSILFIHIFYQSHLNYNLVESSF